MSHTQVSTIEALHGVWRAISRAIEDGQCSPTQCIPTGNGGRETLARLLAQDPAGHACALDIDMTFDDPQPVCLAPLSSSDVDMLVNALPLRPQPRSKKNRPVETLATNLSKVNY